MSNRLRVAILGATGMVGQTLIGMLQDHPWFSIVQLFASNASSQRIYQEAVLNRWWMDFPIPLSIQNMPVESIDSIDPSSLDLVFSAISLPKEEVLKLEDHLARKGLFVVSCNSAYRLNPLVPMIIPYVNPHHLSILHEQRLHWGYTKGAIIVKSNCSIQNYVIPLEPLKAYSIKTIRVHSSQAISGAGKTFATWPEMEDNMIPLIPGEEEKSETEPLKLWGEVQSTGIKMATTPQIKAKCIRVPIPNGHTGYVQVQFEDPHLTKEKILSHWNEFSPCPHLPSSASQVIAYHPDPDRPQPRLDLMRDRGMGVTIGQLEQEGPSTFSFTALSHNAILGAAGGAVLAAELALHEGYVSC
jgi:aspartate-semialdehyde dehydrogenase